MDSKIALKDIEDYLLLRKRREEAFLRSSLPSTAAAERPSLAKEVENLERQLLEAECHFTTAGVKIVVPQEKRLEDIHQSLQTHSADDLAQAVFSKKGDTYALIRSRWQILSSNAENRDSISKFNLLLRRLGYEKSMRLIGAMRLGLVATPIDLSDFSPNDRHWIPLLFSRLGIPSSLEGNQLVAADPPVPLTKIIHHGVAFWFDHSQAEKFSRLSEELRQVSQKLQSYTAQHHARPFSEAQEKDFEAVQLHYLELSKSRDDMLETFQEEKRLFELNVAIQ